MSEVQYALFDRTAMRMMLTHKFETYVHGGIGWIDPRELKVGHKTNFGTVVFVGNEEQMRAYMATHEPWK